MPSPLQTSSQLLQRHPQLFGQQHLTIAGHIVDDYALELLGECHSIQLCCSNFVQFKQLQSHASTVFTLSFSAQPTLEKSSTALLIYMPKAKQELAYLLACLLPQLAKGSEVFIVGENRSGVKSCEKLLAEHGLSVQKLDSARRCSLYYCSLNQDIKAFDPQQWQHQFKLSLPQGELSVSSLPGVFNHGKLDQGTKLLLEQIPPLSGKVLDFGCGAGIIGAALAMQTPLNLSLLDVNSYAIASTEATLNLNNLSGTVFASDGLSEVSECFNYIVSNPPFHTGVATDYSVVEAFFAQAKQHLLAQGEFWLVANSHLPYEGLLKKHFTCVELCSDNRQFKIIRAR